MTTMSWRLIWLFAISAAAFLMRPERHRPLDPDEPIAADRSMSAGRARTIFQFEPALGALDEPKVPDLDDPARFVSYFKIQETAMDNGRAFVRFFLSTPRESVCEDAMHQSLIYAIHRYYGARGVQKTNFTRYGPKAAAFIQSAWATDTDQQIDASVRDLFVAGYLSKNDLQGNLYPELEKVVSTSRPSEKRCN
jgi:hypothetical protein